MSIETEYRGFKIHYGENIDQWGCHALDLYAATLSALKRKIDIVERKTRQTEAIPAFRVSHHGDIEPVTITAKVGKSADGGRRFWNEREGVWCFSEKDKSRRRTELKNLVEDTSDNRKLLDRYVQLVGERKRAEKAANDFLEAIPRMSFERIPEPDSETDLER